MNTNTTSTQKHDLTIQTEATQVNSNSKTTQNFLSIKNDETTHLRTVSVDTFNQTRSAPPNDKNSKTLPKPEEKINEPKMTKFVKLIQKLEGTMFSIVNSRPSYSQYLNDMNNVFSIYELLSNEFLIELSVKNLDQYVFAFRKILQGLRLQQKLFLKNTFEIYRKNIFIAGESEYQNQIRFEEQDKINSQLQFIGIKKQAFSSYKEALSSYDYIEQSITNIRSYYDQLHQAEENEKINIVEGDMVIEVNNKNFDYSKYLNRFLAKKEDVLDKAKNSGTKQLMSNLLTKMLVQSTENQEFLNQEIDGSSDIHKKLSRLNKVKNQIQRNYGKKKEQVVEQKNQQEELLKLKMKIQELQKQTENKETQYTINDVLTKEEIEKIQYNSHLQKLTPTQQLEYQRDELYNEAVEAKFQFKVVKSRNEELLQEHSKLYRELMETKSKIANFELGSQKNLVEFTKIKEKSNHLEQELKLKKEEAQKYKQQLEFQTETFKEKRLLYTEQQTQFSALQNEKKELCGMIENMQNQVGIYKDKNNELNEKFISLQKELQAYKDNNSSFFKKQEAKWQEKMEQQLYQQKQSLEKEIAQQNSLKLIVDPSEKNSDKQSINQLKTPKDTTKKPRKSIMKSKKPKNLEHASFNKPRHSEVQILSQKTEKGKSIDYTKRQPQAIQSHQPKSTQPSKFAKNIFQFNQQVTNTVDNVVSQNNTDRQQDEQPSFQINLVNTNEILQPPIKVEVESELIQTEGEFILKPENSEEFLNEFLEQYKIDSKYSKQELIRNIKKTIREFLAQLHIESLGVISQQKISVLESEQKVLQEKTREIQENKRKIEEDIQKNASLNQIQEVNTMSQLEILSPEHNQEESLIITELRDTLSLKEKKIELLYQRISTLENQIAQEEQKPKQENTHHRKTSSSIQKNVYNFSMQSNSQLQEQQPIEEKAQISQKEVELVQENQKLKQQVEILQLQLQQLKLAAMNQQKIQQQQNNDKNAYEYQLTLKNQYEQQLKQLQEVQSKSDLGQKQKLEQMQLLQQMKLLEQQQLQQKLCESKSTQTEKITQILNTNFIKPKVKQEEEEEIKISNQEIEQIFKSDHKQLENEDVAKQISSFYKKQLGHLQATQDTYKVPQNEKAKANEQLLQLNLNKQLEKKQLISYSELLQGIDKEMINNPYNFPQQQNQEKQILQSSNIKQNYFLKNMYLREQINSNLLQNFYEKRDYSLKKKPITPRVKKLKSISNLDASDFYQKTQSYSQANNEYLNHENQILQAQEKENQIAEIYNQFLTNARQVGLFSQPLDNSKLLFVKNQEKKKKLLEIIRIILPEQAKKYEKSDMLLSDRFSEDGFPSYDQFRQYFFKFNVQHGKSCGENCIHLQRFYKKIGFIQKQKNSQFQSINIPNKNINSLPKIFHKISNMNYVEDQSKGIKHELEEK